MTVPWARRDLRTVLFAPGSEPRKLARLATFGADVLVIDLEDAVAEERKTEARTLAREAAAGYETDAVVAIRVNALGTGRMEDDLAAIVVPGVQAVVIPKVETGEELATADAALSAAERQHGLQPGSIGLIGLVETATGMVACERLLADAPGRLVTAMLGLGDLTVDLRLQLSPDFAEVQHARSRLVLAARAAGLARPIDGPYLDLTDEAGLIADCERSRRLGFQGRVVVYPPQVAPAAAAYGALPDLEVARLQRLVDAFEAAERAGSASLRHEGEFVDYPIYHRAREALMRHEATRRHGARA